MTLRVHPDEIVKESHSPLLGKHESWLRVRLDEVAEVTNGSAFQSNLFNSEGVGTPLIRIRDVGTDRSGTWYSGPYNPSYIVNPGDLLVGMDGDFRASRWKGGPALLNQRVCRLRIRNPDYYDDRLLEYLLQGYLDAIHQVTSSITVAHLSSKTVQDLPLPLPPINEQRRIVDAVEEHFSRIDGAQKSVHSAGSRLAGFWNAFLHQIFDPTWDRPLLVEVNDPERPVCYGILKPRTSDPGVIPYVEVRSISQGEIKVDELHKTTLELHEAFLRSALKPDDVVMAIRGSYDRAAVVPETLIGANVSRDVARMSPTKRLLPGYLAAFLVSPEAQRYFSEHARGVAVQGVNIGDLRRLPVPVPDIEDQRSALARIENLGAANRRIGEEIDVAERRSDQLRRSVLLRRSRADWSPRTLRMNQSACC